MASAAGLAADAALWAGNLAAAHVKLGELDEAERFNNEAKRFKTAAGSGGAVYNTLRAADIATKRGQLAEASRLFEEALAGEPRRSERAVVGARRARAGGRRRPDARPRRSRHFEAALETIEKTRSDLIKTDYKLSYLTRLITFYRAYVDALVDQGQIERALEVADSSRGRVLAERQGVASPQTARAASFRARAAGAKMVFLSYWLAPAGRICGSSRRPACRWSRCRRRRRSPRSCASTRPPSTTSWPIR